jgi:hypothetical protein
MYIVDNKSINHWLSEYSANFASMNLCVQTPVSQKIIKIKKSVIKNCILKYVMWIKVRIAVCTLIITQIFWIPLTCYLYIRNAQWRDACHSLALKKCGECTSVFSAVVSTTSQLQKITISTLIMNVMIYDECNKKLIPSGNQITIKMEK